MLHVTFYIGVGAALGVFVTILVQRLCARRDRDLGAHIKRVERAEHLHDGALVSATNSKHSWQQLVSNVRTFFLARNIVSRKDEELREKAELILTRVTTEMQRRKVLLERRLEAVSFQHKKLKNVQNKLIGKLEKLSGMTRFDARAVLIKLLEDDAKVRAQKWVKTVEEESRKTAKMRSASIVATVMQRYVANQVTANTSSTVSLPSEEIKGRIIGKEGRNIRALERATGMEFIIGEAPDLTISISGFNPLRREVARRVLSMLISDGRINPTRIEEIATATQGSIDREVEEHGKLAVMEFGLKNVHAEIVKLLGRLHFRTSYTQNVLTHSKEVGYFARLIAAELGFNEIIAARCGLLHDIGKALSAQLGGTHASIGARMARQYGEDEIVVNAIEAHHEEVPYTSIYGLITVIADAISAARPGARRETLAAYIKRVDRLEKLVGSFDGVKKSYALQAGREVRVIVDESSLDDQQAALLAKDIAKRVAEEMNFPGQIKIHVIRENRIVEYAR